MTTKLGEGQRCAYTSRYMGQAYTYIAGISQNGREVYVKIINSLAARYFSRQPHLLGVTKEALLTLDLAEPTVAITIDMGRAIGNTHVVSTGEKDSIFYAHQPKKAINLRFVKNRSMESSQELSLVLERDDDGDYEIVNAWVGSLYPPFPDAADATDESETYWQTHALTEGSEPIDLQTVTTRRPY